MIKSKRRVISILIMSIFSILKVTAQNDRTYTIDITRNDLSKLRNLTVGYNWAIHASEFSRTSLDNMHSFLVNYRLDKFGSVSLQSHIYFYDSEYHPEVLNYSKTFFGTHDLVFTYGIGNKQIFKKSSLKINPITNASNAIEVNRALVNELRLGYLLNRSLLYKDDDYSSEGSIFGLANVIQLGWQLGVMDDVEYDLQLVESYGNSNSWKKPRPYKRKLSKIWYCDIFYGVGLRFTDLSNDAYTKENGFSPRTEKQPWGGRVGFRRQGLRNMHLGWTFEIGSIPQQALLNPYALQGLYVRMGLYLPLVSVRVPTPEKIHFKD
ncbi:MAG: hypothetical protein ACPGLV_03085 [Bacteroidia bacterium]